MKTYDYKTVGLLTAAIFSPAYYCCSSDLGQAGVKTVFTPIVTAASCTLMNEIAKKFFTSNYSNQLNESFVKILAISKEILPIVGSLLATHCFVESYKTSPLALLKFCAIEVPLYGLSAVIGAKIVDLMMKPKVVVERTKINENANFVTLSSKGSDREKYIAMAYQALINGKANLTRTDLIDPLLRPDGLLEHYGMSIVLNTQTNKPHIAYKDTKFIYLLENVGPKELEDEIREDLSRHNIALPSRLYN
ncbi:MAG: hypothetical protein H0X29_06710 [Parachlamydiaceae bacterium]|nr:hypothetical protein [Parachlamydiaceae bacterium]